MIFWVVSMFTILAIYSIILANNIRNLLCVKSLNEYDNIAGDFPKLSIIIPARNEEDNIEICALSILNQNYPNFEVIIINDDSTDNTLEIIKKLKKKYFNCRIININKLPKRWNGKNWANHKGYLASSGSILLFTDADTFFEQGTLLKSVSALLYEQADLLSSHLYQKVVTFSENAVIPLIFWIVYSIFSFSKSKKKNPLFSYAIGKFIMIKRTAYVKINGHKAIKDIIIDDVFLAKNICKHRMKSVITDSTEYLICRMYNNSYETIKGFSKLYLSAFKYKFSKFISIPIFILTFIFLNLLIYGPIISLIFIITLHVKTFITNILMALTITIITMTVSSFFIIYLKNRSPLYMILLYPLNWLFITVFIPAITLYLYAKKDLKWKGRSVF
jgi:chlorobactene glucosyltransferase